MYALLCLLQWSRSNSRQRCRHMLCCQTRQHNIFHFIGRSFISGLMDLWLSLQQWHYVIKGCRMLWCQIIRNFLALCKWTLKRSFAGRCILKYFLLTRRGNTVLCVRDLNFDFLPHSILQIVKLFLIDMNNPQEDPDFQPQCWLWPSFGQDSF